MRCPKCGYPNREGAVACEHCGARLRVPCPRCGFGLDEGDAACPRCGQAVAGGRMSRSASERDLFVLAGRYQVLQQVSRGRTSAVYRARDNETGDTVAVKRLELVALVTPDEKRRALSEFEREAALLEELRHPGIVPIRSHFREKDSVGVVMPWIEGSTLQEIYRRGPLPEPQVRALGAQLADALAFLHSQNPRVLLRDLKPSHVIVNGAGDAILLDLGLSRHFKAGQSRGEANRGTPPFEAPEQAADAYAGPESDIYALGSLLLLLARGPKGDTGAVSPTLRRILARARRADPEKRYRSMAHFRRALAPDSETVSAPASEATARRRPRGSAPARKGAEASRPAPRPAAVPEISVVTKRLRIVRNPNRRRVGYRLRLHNNVQRPVTAQVRSAVPWLEPASDTVELEPGGDGEVLVRVDLTQVPPHTRRLARALQVIGASRHWVPAEVVEPAPVLELERETLDFGRVGPEGAVAGLAVRNAGGGLLSAHVSASVPWLQVTTPDLVLGAGQSRGVEVRLSADAPPTGGTFARALLVDSDVGQAYSDVVFSRGQAELSVQPQSLDFGRVRHPETAQTELVLSNTGSAPVSVRLRSAHEALSLAATEVNLPARTRARLGVRLDTASLGPGALELPSGVRITSPAGNHQLSVDAEVVRPLLAVSEATLDFGTLAPEQVPSAQTALVVSNRGNEGLAFELIPEVPWLTAWPSEGRLGPGSSTVLTLSLTDKAAEVPGTHEGAPAAIVRSEGGTIGISARYRLVKPVLELEPASLDFGVIPEQGVSERHITIANSGTGDLHWRAVADAPWIELSPSAGVCPEDDTVVVTTRAYGLALPAGTREARASIAFEGPHNHRSVRAAVSLSQPILAVEPAVDLPDSVDFEPVEGRLTLFNRGVGELRATVRSSVPWVSVPHPEVVIPSGRSGTLLLQAAPPTEMEPGETALPAALLVSSNGGEAEVELRLTLVTRPQIEVTPDRLVLKPGAEGAIIVRNAGLATVKGTVRASHPWLSVDPRQLTIRPGHRARLRVAPGGERDEGPERATVTVSVGEHTEEVEVVVSE